ncbi:MAG: hypothetical protein U0441_35040 [Polyangiaceae bacterium]
MADLIRLRDLIEQERQVIRTRDSAAILAMAEQKEAVLASLKKHAEDGQSQAVREGLKDLAPALRQNLVLLAHARDCLRDAIETLRGEVMSPLSANKPASPLRPGMRISVVG